MGKSLGRLLEPFSGLSRKVILPSGHSVIKINCIDGLLLQPSGRTFMYVKENAFPGQKILKTLTLIARTLRGKSLFLS